MAIPHAELAGILYYAREKYYQHIQTEVLQIQKKHGSDSILIYWKAYSLVMNGRLLEGMREVDKILDKPETILCAPMLLAYAHKKCETVDREAIQSLEGKVRAERTSCGEMALYNAGVFLWLNNRHEKAKEYIDRILKMNPANKEALAVKGWIDLTSEKDAQVKRAIKFFEDSLASPDHPKCSEALFGKAKFYTMRYNFSHSLEVLNEAVASYQGFIPALVEKMKVQLSLQDWEQTVETAQRCLTEDSNCIEAVRILALHLLAREGSYDEAAGKIANIIRLIDRHEPNNHGLYFSISLAFARMAGGKEMVLQQTIILIHRALSLSPNNSDYINELGYQLYLKGDLKEALIHYKKALNTDESSVVALAGIILCQILEGRLAEAEQQLEFLAEIQNSVGKQADLIFLDALLAQKKNRPAAEVLPLLNDVIDAHFASIKGTPLSTMYFQKLNPHFLMQVTNAILTYAPSEPAQNTSQADSLLKRAMTILDPIRKSMPGMLSATYQAARINFLMGNFGPARLLLDCVLEKDSSDLEAHLLMARLHLWMGNISQCSASLEFALSSNFEVQNNPSFHVIKAQCERQGGDLQSALASLNVAMDFIIQQKSKEASFLEIQDTLSLNEQVTVYMELASIHTELGQVSEATKVIEDAIGEFSGTSEEFRITIATAEFALARDDIDEALALLRKVSKDNNCYIQAKEKMAEIYLNKKKDKKMYISCYEELATTLPGPPTALILGDAYMSIQEPEKALEVYEAALKKNARDSVLASKIGQALIKTHNYTKAIIYYETALKSETQQFLRSDLAELFLKLSEFEKAEKTLEEALEKKEEPTELAQMVSKLNYMLLLTKVHKKARNFDKALMVLSIAKELQSKIITRAKIEQPSEVQSQKDVAASICFDMAELNEETSNTENAIVLFQEALKRKPNFIETRLALAKLYLRHGNLDACDQECISLLAMDHDNEEATLMRADLLLHRGSDMYKEAIHHLQELLTSKPAHFEALCRLVELYQRSGEIETCEPFLDRAEKECSHSAYEPALNYCKGLYRRYKRDVNGALQFFNLARKDVDWGEKALFHMIAICLNPDNELIAGDTLKSEDQSSDATEDTMAVKTAEKLLLEIHPRTADIQLKIQVLECNLLLSTRNKQNIEKALETFMELAMTYRNNVSVLLGIATCHMLLKQTPRARNQLKISSKIQWTPEFAEDFEQTWLLLADIYVQSGKYDVALELLKKCLQYNKSCSKAWEYKGFISEKEQAYKDAATFYDKAWKYSYYANPSVGFKLAFNYLKAKWYVDAIDVCHQVLGKHPSYPKIRKEILEKARLALRA